MGDRERIASIYRRAAFGLRPGEIDQRVAAGLEATIDELVDPDAHGLAVAVDPWDDAALRVPNPTRELIGTAIAQWVQRMVDTPRPLEEWMAWFWHGHFATGVDKVRSPFLMVQQVRTLQSLALGSFPALVRAVTVDPAMLLYLDGVESSGASPNENYGRELQELFTVGIDSYTEDDVRAASIALTGWRITRQTPGSQLFAALHDDTPQLLQGRAGVHDVDTVVEAVTSAPACAPFIAGKVAEAILGPAVSKDVIDRLAGVFRDSGLEIRPLVRAAIESIDDATPILTAPVPWVVGALRATGARPDPRIVLLALRAAGQLPFLPPNVGGWPGGAAWLGASTVVARFNLASVIAQSAPAPTAVPSDLEALGDLVGLPAGFSEATRAVLTGIGTAAGDAGVARLALALASPDLAVAESEA